MNIKLYTSWEQHDDFTKQNKVREKNPHKAENKSDNNYIEVQTLFSLVFFHLFTPLPFNTI